MTTTELIKILKDNEYGGISHKPRELSLTINGKYMPNPQITLSSTGDGICGAEIDLDVDGEFCAEQEPCGDAISRQAVDEIINDIRDCISVEGYWAILERLKKLPPVKPQEPRKITLEDVKEYCKPRYLTIISNELLYELTHPKIKALEQEPKTGHWILKRTFPTKLYDENLNEYKCSECYREIRCTESQLVNYQYCHCGAKMVEQQESEG